MKKIMLFALVAVLLSSCGATKKEYEALKQQKEDLENQVYKLNAQLDECLNNGKISDSKIASLNNQIKTLESTNSALLNAQGDFATISKKAAENLERSLESIKEKDKQLRTLRDAVNKRDSVTLALVTSLKGALGNLQDEDIQINVEKGVVFVSISDKLLFKSGSYAVTQKARKVLGKVAKVVNAKPDIEFMVEGHTDTTPVKSGIPNMKDNWDLSTLRADAVVRILQNDYHVDPTRMTAAGRGQYVPVASNDTAEGRAKNRRTRIVVLPKLDRFYELIEKGMKKAEENSMSPEEIDQVKEELHKSQQ